MTAFNITNLTSQNITSMTALFQSVNDVTFSTLFPALSIGMWVLLFTSLNSKTQNLRQSAIASSFAIFIINTVLFLSGLLSGHMVFIPLLVFAFSLFAIN